MPSDPAAGEDFVEVFSTSSQIAVHKVVFVLVRNGIEGGIHDRMFRAFPGGTAYGALYIAVRPDQAAQARAILEDAVKTGVIDATDGDRL